jgi:hypothetical protein
MPRLSSHRGGPPASLFSLGNVARKPGWKKPIKIEDIGLQTKLIK